MNATAKLLGVTDETTVCECCGKTNLKRVAVLELADGSVVRYGRDCAARKLGKSMGKSIDAKVQQMNDIATMKALIAKWEGKFPGEQIANHLNVKFGYCVYFSNGQYKSNVGVL